MRAVLFREGLDLRFNVEMARKPFVIVCPDGSKRNVSGPMRNALVLTSEIRLREGTTYDFVGEKRTVHRLSDLGELAFMRRVFSPSFLAGSFTVVDSDGRKHHETLETPERLEVRVLEGGWGSFFTKATVAADRRAANEDTPAK